jgi:putative glutamine amidotransferase
LQPLILSTAHRRPRATQLPHGILLAKAEVFACVSEVVETVIRKLGATCVLLPTLHDKETALGLLDSCDGVLLPGSVHDLDPSCYGESPDANYHVIDPTHDETDLFLVRAAAQRKIPFLGICRGMQAMNVAFGGGLIQKIRGTGIDHYCGLPCDGRRNDPPFVHPVTVKQGGALAKILDGCGPLAVNSMHNQAAKEIGEGLVIEAEAPDGIVEALSYPAAETFFMGVQWHPECAAENPASVRLFDAFRQAVHRHKAAREDLASAPDQD